MALVGLALSTVGYGQTQQSPYSSYGIGEIQSTAVTGQLSSGGIGIGGGHAFYNNTRNSAWLARNQFTIFDIGAQGESRAIRTDSSVTNIGSGGLRSLALVFPIVQKTKFRWTSSVGMLPYSTVSYRLTTERPLDGEIEEATYVFEGSGGYNQVYWSNGLMLSKNFYVGLKASYLFGSISRESVVTMQPQGVVASQNIAILEQSSLSDFNWEASLGYEAALTETLRLRAGAVYGAAANLNTQVLNRIDVRNSYNVATNIDTINYGAGTQFFPHYLGVGLAFEKRNNWVIGLDAEYQPWSQYRDTQGELDPNLTDLLRLVLGSQITPGWNSTRYLQRVGYGLGFSYENTPISINGRQINDFGINFGLSLPVSRFNSSLNMSVQVGTRGTIEADLIRENYVKLNLGVSYNQLWFVRSKYD